jgi:hypothetical protein
MLLGSNRVKKATWARVKGVTSLMMSNPLEAAAEREHYDWLEKFANRWKEM